MTTIDTKAIRERCKRLSYYACSIEKVVYSHDHQQSEPFDNSWREDIRSASTDIPALLDEIERLRGVLLLAATRLSDMGEFDSPGYAIQHYTRIQQRKETKNE